ncbi:MAG: helix-turn-helix domain-containing protein [Proteobacteria bacterium]|nr:helix-turn-helix domain-containing protein [Pseudomonadota bacterium]
MNESKTPPPDVMNVEDLAVYLQVSKRSIYNMASSGEVPRTKIKGQWRFTKPTIDRWLEEQIQNDEEDRRNALET